MQLSLLTIELSSYLLGDGKVLRGFRRQGGRREAEQFEVDVRGVHQLKLITSKFTDGATEVKALWGDLELERLIGR